MKKQITYDGMTFAAERIKELTMNRIQKRERQGYRPHRFVTVAVALTFVIGVGSVAAASNLGLFDFLLSRNAVTPEQRELVQETIIDESVDEVTITSREYLFDGEKLYILAEVTSADNKFIAGDDYPPTENPELYKAIGIALQGDGIVSNSIDYRYNDDGSLVFVVEAEANSLNGATLRFAVNPLDENGERALPVANIIDIELDGSAFTVVVPDNK
jgi:hypothetical protein